MQDSKVTWRTTEKTFSEWSTRNIYNKTSREAARIIGTIMRQDYVRSATSLTQRSSVLLLQLICKRMSLRDDKDWDVPNTISQEDASTTLRLIDTT